MTTTKTAEPVTGQTAGAETPAVGNLTEAALGQRMKKGRKAASDAKPATKATAKPATTATSSEQAEADEAKTDLSHPETDDSAALAAEAETAETDGGPDEEAGGAEPNASEDEGATANEEEGAEQLPKAVKDLQKRVNKLTAKNAELTAKNAELQEQMTRKEAGQSPQAPPPHPADRAVSSDRAVGEFDSQLAGIEAFLAWATENPDGGSYSEGDKTYQLNADEVRGYRLKSESERVRLNARREARMETIRAEFDAKRRAAHEQAVRLYPWVEQKASPEFQEALAIIRENPAVLDRADFELVIARQVAGQRLEREALKKGAPKPGAKAARTATPVVTFSPTAARKPDAKAATTSAAEKRFKEGGGRESDLSKLLAQRRLERLEAAKG